MARGPTDSMRSQIENTVKLLAYVVGKHLTPRNDILQFLAQSYAQDNSVDSFARQDSAEHKCFNTGEAYVIRRYTLR